MSYGDGNYNYEAPDYTGPGYVEVFDFNAITDDWVQRGDTITANYGGPRDQFGSMIAMSVDGNRIAVGASMEDFFGGNQNAKIIVYDWNNAENDWEELVRFAADKGIENHATCIAMNKYGTVIVAATINDGNTATSDAASLVSATLGSSGEIANMGDSIALVQSNTYALAMNADGKIIAHGVPNPGGGNPFPDSLVGTGNGSVTVHRWSVARSAWEAMGDKLMGNRSWDGFGESVALSANGMVLAVGAAASVPDYRGLVYTQAEIDAKIQQVPAGGYVKVFDFHEGANSWVQRGLSLTGEDGSHGRSVALSADGNVLAIGEYNHGPPKRYGRVLVYSWDYATDHEWKLVGEVDGELEFEEFGWSVALSDDGATLVVGARRGEQVGFGVMSQPPESPNQGKGHVRVFVATAAPPPSPPSAPTSSFLSRYANYAQIGEEMRGSARVDFAGASVALSRDGTTLVFGAPEDSEFMSYGVYRTYQDDSEGYVEVHRLDSSSSPPSWAMIGSRLEGDTDFNRHGRSVAINEDGSRIVIGRPAYYGVGETNRAIVLVYEWDDSLLDGSGDWSQVGGEMPTSYNSNVQCGNSVAMSDDGSVVAMGCLSDIHYRTWNLDAGFVQVYEWDASIKNWTRRGQELDAENGGHMVALSGDGRIVAIGAPLSIPQGSNTDPSYHAGSTRVYEWDAALNGGNGDWLQRGDAFDPVIYGAQYGSSVALSVDGSVLAIGAPTNTYGARPSNGSVAVFSWDGSVWVAMGNVITGPQDSSHIGESVALNDAGDVLAVGAHRYGAGTVWVYAWDEVANGWSEVGSGIDGSEGLFSSVALDGNGTRLAIGAWPAADTGNFDISDGLVRVYDAVPFTPPSWGLPPPPSPSPPPPLA